LTIRFVERDSLQSGRGRQDRNMIWGSKVHSRGHDELRLKRKGEAAEFSSLSRSVLCANATVTKVGRNFKKHRWTKGMKLFATKVWREENC